MRYLVPFQVLSWNILLVITLRHYRTIGALRDGIWVDARPSVWFMTVDAIILFAAVILWVAFHNEILAVKALLLSLLVVPGAGPVMVLGEIEEMKFATFGYYDNDLKKKISSSILPSSLLTCCYIQYQYKCGDRVCTLYL